MKIKKMDMEKRIYEWIPSNLLLVTFKGSGVPEKLHMYNNLVKIPVKPYVESVIQCFQCYGFRHWKDKCKRERVYIICGEEYRGRCDRREKCVNCKGNHMANDRKCEKYLKQEEINRMAKEGINGQEAKKRTEKEKGRRTKEDRNNRKEAREKEKIYLEEKRMGEARASTWAGVVRGSNQEKEKEYGREEREEKDRETSRNRSEEERRRRKKKRNGNEEGVGTTTGQMARRESRKVRVEEIVIRYIRGRFMEMEQWVEEKKQ